MKNEINLSTIWVNASGFFASVLCTILTILFFSSEIYCQFGSEVDLSKSTILPSDITGFDLDNDGDIDIICAARRSEKIAWYENLGNGDFSSQKIIANTAEEAFSIKVIDIDGDGLADVVCALDAPGMIVWYRNLGNEIFGVRQVVSSTVDLARSVDCADMNGDGLTDILAVSTGNEEILYFENSGNGVFAAGQTVLSSFQGANDVFCSDVDGDGDTDILASSSAPGGGESVWIENLGGGAFGPKEVISEVARGEIYSDDLDGDGDTDVLNTGNNGYSLMWHENLGNGVFGEFIVVPSDFNGSATGSLHTADIDNDGDQDILSGAQGRINWNENLGEGNFGQLEVISNETDGRTIVFAADLTGNGLVDILSASGSDNLIGWFENLGDGEFGTRNSLSPSAQQLHEAIAADFDNDGAIDVVASNKKGGLQLYRNLGGAEFLKPVALDVDDGPRNISAVDLDGDGDLDILTHSSTDEGYFIVWYENFGELNFSESQIIAENAGNAWAIDTGDLDGDGDLDIVFADFSIDRVAQIENLGNGNFGEEEVITYSVNETSSLVLVDINQDGALDIFISEADQTGSIGRSMNLGDGSFSPFLNIDSEEDMDPYHIEIVDINGDGNPDILAALRGFDSVVWYEGDSEGNFNSNYNLISDQTSFVGDVAAADLDQDGDPDVYSASASDNKIAWYENLGDGTFGEQQIVSNIANGARTVFAADLDDDGDLDILSASFRDNKVAWYENLTYQEGIVTGKLFYDTNQDGIEDSADFGFDLMGVYSDPPRDYGFTTPNGMYTLKLNNAVESYTIFPEALSGWSITSDSTSYSVLMDSVDTFAYDSLNFGFFPDTLFTRLHSDLTGGFPRCNSLVNYWIDVRNTGTVITSGVIQIELDDSLIYLSSSLEPDSIIEQNIYWHLDSLTWFSSFGINLQVEMPDFNSIGDTLISVVQIYNFDEGDDFIFSISDTLEQELVCAYDPNDKAVSPAGMGDEGYIPLEQELKYLIRFQNTGNDTAFTVTIKDQLDSNLDFASVNPIAGSHHPMQVNVDQDGEIEFIFENIMLPDSNVDQLGSQGFVKFSVMPLPDLAPNTPIENSARIYFDFNPPIITNTVLNTIECYNTPFPSISYADTILMTDAQGEFSYQWFFNGDEIPGAIGDTLSPIGDGIYTLSVADSTNCAKLSNGFSLTLSGIDEIAHLDPVIFPNPFRQTTTISFSEPLNGQYGFEVYNALGQLMHRESSINDRRVILHESDLGKGVFLCYLINRQSALRYFVGKVVVI